MGRRNKTSTRAAVRSGSSAIHNKPPNTARTPIAFGHENSSHSKNPVGGGSWDWVTTGVPNFKGAKNATPTRTPTAQFREVIMNTRRSFAPS